MFGAVFFTESPLVRYYTKDPVNPSIRHFYRVLFEIKKNVRMFGDTLTFSIRKNGFSFFIWQNLLVESV